MYVLTALVFLVVFMCWGYWKGLLDVVLRLFSLAGAYALTWQEAPNLATYLSQQAVLPGLLVWPVAGGAVFLGGIVLFSLLSLMLKSLAPDEWLEGGRKSGALLGGLLGCGLGVLAVWTGSVVQDAWRIRQAGGHVEAVASPPAAAEPLAQADQVLRQFSGQAMATLAQEALGKGAAGTVAAQWVREPMSVSANLKYLAEKPELRELFQDPANYAVMVQGSPMDVQRLPAFAQLAGDPQVMGFLAMMGLPGSTDRERAAQLAGMMSRYTRNFERLRHTPEFQSLSQDPELRAQLQQGNLMVLLTNDKMRKMAEMLMQQDSPAALPGAPAMLEQAGQMAAGNGSGASHDPDAAPKPLYRWRDPQGRVHITETPPPEGTPADVFQH